MGFAIAVGASGACVLPFAVGALAQARGFWVLMPVVLCMLVLDGLVWASLPKAEGEGGKWSWTARWLCRGKNVSDTQVRETGRPPLSTCGNLETGGV